MSSTPQDDYTLPLLRSPRSLCSTFSGNRKAAVRRSSIQCVYGMREIKEDSVVDVQAADQKPTAPTKKMTLHSNYLTSARLTRRNSDVENKTQPVMLRNNRQKLRKYSCPDMYYHSNISSEQKHNTSTVGSHTLKPSGSSSQLSVNNNETETTQLQQPNKQHSVEDKQSIDTRFTELSNKDKTKILPRIKLESRERFTPSISPRKTARSHEWALGEEDYGIDGLSVNSSSMFNASNAEEETITVLSFASDMRKDDRNSLAKPKATRARSSVVAWLQEVNSTLRQ